MLPGSTITIFSATQNSSDLIIGNVAALLASIAMTLSGLFKNKKQIIFMQIIQVALAVISNLVLGGYVGAIVNFINLIRNIICYKDKLDIKGIIIITIFSFSLYFLNFFLLLNYIILILL